MATVQLNDSQSRLDFFQQRILRTVEHWHSHEAVQNVEVAVLDRKREAILRAIALGLDFDPAWFVVKHLVIAFTPYMERRGYWEAWKGILDQAVGIAQRLEDIDAETTLTSLLARLCQRMSRPQDTIYYYRRAIRLSRMQSNKFEEARACSNLGYLYIDRGRWWRSEVLNLHALDLFEKEGSDHGKAHTHNHLGALYSRQRLWEKSEEHLQNACDLWAEKSDRHNLTYGLLNLGYLYNSQELSSDAIRALSAALQTADATGEEALAGGILNNLAIAYRQNQDYVQAKLTALRAEEILRKYARRTEIAQVWHNLGLIVEELGQLPEAKKYFQASLKMYEEIRHEQGIKWLMDTLDKLNTR